MRMPLSAQKCSKSAIVTGFAGRLSNHSVVYTALRILRPRSSVLSRFFQKPWLTKPTVRVRPTRRASRMTVVGSASSWTVREQMLTVTLSRPREGTYKLHVESETALPEFPSVIDLPVMLRQHITAIALGYEDINDHDKLRLDPLLARRVRTRRCARP